MTEHTNKSVDIFKFSVTAESGLLMEKSPSFQHLSEGEQLDLLAAAIDVIAKEQRFIIHRSLLNAIVDPDNDTKN